MSNVPASIGPAAAPWIGDRIVFHVETVVELDPSVVPHIDTTVPGEVTYRAVWRDPFLQRSFPDTKEARASIRSAPL